MARKNAYDEKIKPNFDLIKKLLTNGKTERSVAGAIGIGYSTWNKYKEEKSEFKELIKKSREKPVDDLIFSMYRSGMGFSKIIQRMAKCKTAEYDPETGKKIYEKEQMVPYEEEIYIPPNFQAAKYLIQNWGKDLGFSSEPAMLDLKKKELEFKQAQAEKENW